MCRYWETSDNTVFVFVIVDVLFWISGTELNGYNEGTSSQETSQLNTKKALRGGVRVCNNLLQPPKTKMYIGIGLRKIVAYSHAFSQCLLVSTVFGTVSSLHYSANVHVHACVLCARIKRKL